MIARLAHPMLRMSPIFETVGETGLLRRQTCSLRPTKIALRQTARMHKQGWSRTRSRIRMMSPPGRRKIMDVLGIDLAKLSFDATLLLQTGSSHYASFPNTPEGFLQLATWLKQHTVSSLHACMEATNIYWQALASWLHAQGYSVSVVNPARIKGYAMATMQRNKTDKLASAVIAAFCKTHHPTAWQPLSEAHKRLRALTRQREDLLQTRLQQQNRLRDTTDTLVLAS